MISSYELKRRELLLEGRRLKFGKRSLDRIAEQYRWFQAWSESSSRWTALVRRTEAELQAKLAQVQNAATEEAYALARMQFRFKRSIFAAIVSTLFTAAVMTILTERYVEPRAGAWDPAERPPDAPVEPMHTDG